jgi:hypothetical protein
MFILADLPNYGAPRNLYPFMRKLHGWKLGLSRCYWFICIAAGGGMFPQCSAAAIAYVQGNYVTPQSPQQTVSVKYLAAQAAGDLNVVIVGWKNIASAVSSVSDRRPSLERFLFL